ncbi:MAG: OmpA family protein [Gemmatimonadaceae bacterium]
MSSLKSLAAIALSAVSLTACATKGYVRQQVETGVSTERVARVAGDSSLNGTITTVSTDLNSVKGEVSTLKTDVQALRRDLTALRTEFGAKITAMEDGMKFAMPVNFAYDDSAVRDEDRPLLDRFAQVMNKYYGGAMLTVEGFADPAGSKHYNLDLSQRRADNVAAYLSQAGLSGLSLKAVGYGEDRQVAPGAEKEQPGAQANRRVVFVVETKAGGATVSSIQ